MTPQRNAAVAAALMLALAGWDFAWLVGSAGVTTSGPAPILAGRASSLVADAAHADAPQVAATRNAAIDKAEATRTAELVTATATEKAVGSDYSQSIAAVSPTDVSQTPPVEAPAVPLATASTPAGSGSAGVETTGAAPIPDRPASSVVADAAHADASQATATDNAASDAAVDKAEVTRTAEAVTGTATEKVATTETTAAIEEAAAAEKAANSNETPPVSVAGATIDASQAPPPEAAPVQVATASMPEATPSTPDMRLNDAGQDGGSVEIVDECLVLETCVDRYLWTLYKRTPKEDSIKVQDQRQVTVKRKGKTRTVTQTFTRLVDEDFGWKDPKAAEKVGMSMKDYVIGGMDEGFKLKLFQALHAADDAGLSPGITSAFRDDYRQSLASGLHAAANRSYHGGSLRGGYGHGLAADVVSVKGGTRDARWASSEILWKWMDEHGKDLGIGRPYLDRDPAHMAPIDGKEYADHHRGTTAQHVAGSNIKKRNRIAVRDDHNAAKRRSTAKSSKVRTI